MSIPIAPITAPSLLGTIDKVAGLAQGDAFQNVLSSAIQNVEASASSADAATQSYMSGGTQELHSTILATQSAELDFEMFMQVRNKVVSAYEEIMRMQV
ncbi:MAG: flagellar hook-basal body complex protein FliE [Acidobacteriaceae bacterium]|nr:flagellar hook-basal body complex protein FliE [Acidobacteriaceae bacterium]